MKLLICVSLVMSSIGLLVEGFSTGAPVQACDTLSPNPTMHGAQPQISAVPYAISLMPFYNASDSSFTFYPGRTYTLGITNATNGPTTFRGFFVQARLVSDDTTRVGVFAPTGPIADQSRLSSCPIATDGITHNSAVDKDAMYFTWTAPMGNIGDIRFGFAVVETRFNYWANQRTVVVQQAIVTTTTAPATTTTQIQPTQTTLPTNNTMSTADTTVFVIAGVVSTGGLLVVAIIISISTLICIKRRGCMERIEEHNTEPMYDYIDTDPSDILTNGHPQEMRRELDSQALTTPPPYPPQKLDLIIGKNEAYGRLGNSSEISQTQGLSVSKFRISDRAGLVVTVANDDHCIGTLNKAGPDPVISKNEAYGRLDNSGEISQIQESSVSNHVMSDSGLVVTVANDDQCIDVLSEACI